MTWDSQLDIIAITYEPLTRTKCQSYQIDTFNFPDTITPCKKANVTLQFWGGAYWRDDSGWAVYHGTTADGSPFEVSFGFDTTENWYRCIMHVNRRDIGILFSDKNGTEDLLNSNASWRWSSTPTNWEISDFSHNGKNRMTVIVVELGLLPEDIRRAITDGNVTDSDVFLLRKLADSIINPQKLRWKQGLISMKYDQPNFSPPSAIDISATQIVEVKDDPITVTVTANKEIEQSYAWTVSQNIMAGVSVEVAAGVPGIADVTATVNTEFSLGTSRTTTKVERTSFTTQIEVPFSKPGTYSVCLQLDYCDNVTSTFWSEWAVEASTDQFSIPIRLLYRLLQAHYRCNANPDFERGAATNVLYLSTTGTFEGSYGIRAHLVQKRLSDDPKKLLVTRTLLPAA